MNALNLGLNGLILTQNIVSLFKVIFMFSYYTIRKPYPESHTLILPCNKQLYKNFWKNTKIGYFGGLMVFFSSSGECILAIIISTFGRDIYTKHLIISAIGYMGSAFNISVISAVGIVFGIYVGKNEPDTIKKIICHSLSYGNVFIILLLGIMALFPDPFLSFFGEASDNLSQYYIPMYWMISTYYFSYLQNNFHGFLRGFGYIKFASGCSLFFNMVVQNVVGYFLGKAYGNTGFFIGILIMQVGLAISYFVIFIMVDIKKSCAVIQKLEEEMAKNEKEGIEDGIAKIENNALRRRTTIRNSIS
jgi:Na+-driven multidrug efflux pump